jgi:hypothetical protein
MPQRAMLCCGVPPMQHGTAQQCRAARCSILNHAPMRCSHRRRRKYCTSSAWYRLGTHLVSAWYRLVPHATHFVPLGIAWYRLGTGLVPHATGLVPLGTHSVPLRTRSE